MGYALAAQAHARGHEVLLVSGPVGIAAPEGCEKVAVESAQEMFDFCDDYVGWGDVIYEHVVELQAVRREHFLNTLNSQPAARRMGMDEFPPKDAEVEGISWLPRLIVKARAKLEGALPTDLMYG